MPTGFDDYNEDMNEFESSPLFRKKFAELIDIISMPFGEVKSRVLEDRLKIKGPSIRRLTRHARRKGIPIISSSKGYSIAKNFNQLRDTIAQLEERGRDILVTAAELKRCFPDETQQKLSMIA
jgi:2-hydroxy-3-keto-5-methylthiopentenyl-1-phosphate phosphatase